MRPTLRISKIQHTWRWFYEDLNLRYPDRVIEESPQDYPTWQACEAAATTAHPEVREVFRNVVRGHGTDYEDSL